jgi:hypothetical protein
MRWREATARRVAALMAGSVKVAGMAWGYQGLRRWRDTGG